MQYLPNISKNIKKQNKLPERYTFFTAMFLRCEFSKSIKTPTSTFLIDLKINYNIGIIDALPNFFSKMILVLKKDLF